jgi:transposase
VYAVLSVPRLRCRSCGAKRQAEVRFAAPMKSYSRAFARLVVELLVHCSVGFVAKFLGIGWDTVKDIHQRHLRKKYAKPPLKDLTVIAIDEMYLGKALGYRTMVLDLRSGAVVYVGKGKDSKVLMPLLQVSPEKVLISLHFIQFRFHSRPHSKYFQ